MQKLSIISVLLLNLLFAPSLRAQEQEKIEQPVQSEQEPARKQDPALFTQKLFTIKVDVDYSNVAGSQSLEGAVNFFAKKINPNSPRLVIPSFSAKGDIPISVLTDEKGDLLAIVLGKDGAEIQTITNGQKSSLNQNAVYIEPASIAKNKFKVDASSPLRDQHELVYLDATGLSSQDGGKVKIKYVSSLITGGTNEVELRLSRVGPLWVASTDDSIFSGIYRREKYIKEATLSPNMMKLGIDSPSFTFAENSEAATGERLPADISLAEAKAKINAANASIRSLPQQVNGKTRFQNMEFGLRYSEPSEKEVDSNQIAVEVDRSISSAN